MEQKNTNIPELYGYNQQEIDTIKRVMNFQMSDVDLKVFLHVCRHAKLDPLAKQIYAIPRGGKMTIQTSIDGFRLVADRTGKYAPGRPTEYHFNDKGALVAATAYVKKFSGDTWHEIGEQALLCEYAGNTPFWKKMPSVMLAKVAEARALRRAFPADLSGLYTDDEMDQADNKNMPVSKATVIEVKDEIISSDQWESLDNYLNGHTELREQLKELCGVEDLSKIKQSQLAVCRGYAKALSDKEKGVAA